jgi:hypothetical protein
MGEEALPFEEILQAFLDGATLDAIVMLYPWRSISQLSGINQVIGRFKRVRRTRWFIDRAHPKTNKLVV